jgi:uncharacterized protein (TIRG00374 family)
MKEPNNMRRFAKGTAGAIILSTFAAFIILQVTARGETRLSLLRLDLSQLALAGILVGAGWILDAVRIKVLASTLGGGIGFFTALRITLAGAFAACVTPFDTGGEPLQVYLLHKHGFNPGESTAIVALKSLISAVARLFLVLLIPTWYLVRKTWIQTYQISVSVPLFLWHTHHIDETRSLPRLSSSLYGHLQAASYTHRRASYHLRKVPYSRTSNASIALSRLARTRSR